MQYTPELLDKVIKESYEDNHIDFKENFNWHKFNDYHKTKLAKHIAAISNMPNGGMLIFGVSDSKMIVGLTPEDLESIDRTWIDNHLSQYLDPFPININILTSLSFEISHTRLIYSWPKVSTD